MRDVLEATLELLRRGGRGALATVISVKGSAPQCVGARLLLCDDGRRVGTVGGGAIEHEVARELLLVQQDGSARVFRRDLGRDLGMSCGGSMELFLEPLSPLPRLLMFGAGHVAAACAPALLRLGFLVTVIDARAEYNDEARFAGCERILAEPEDALSGLLERPDEWVLCLSHSHALDARAVKSVAKRPLRYLGIMGSKRKIYRMLADLDAEGVALPLERIYAPVGLALGAETPPEIAASICAELVAVRRGRAADHMRVSQDPELVQRLSGGTP